MHTLARINDAAPRPDDCQNDSWESAAFVHDTHLQIQRFPIKESPDLKKSLPWLGKGFFNADSLRPPFGRQSETALVTERPPDFFQRVRIVQGGQVARITILG